MKSQALLGTIGFAVAFLALGYYAETAQTRPAQTALALGSLAAWWLESQAVERKPIDFSTGFLFYLMLSLSGDAVGAGLALLAGFCVREMTGRSHTADLLFCAPVVAALAVMQAGGNWPDLLVGRVGVSLGATALAAALLESGSRYLAGRASTPAASHVEARQRGLRRVLLLYAPSAALLPADKTWALAAVAPLCWALQRSAENIGYRVHAQRAEVMETQLEESQKLLESSQSRLAQVSERQEILEEMTGIFARPLTPEMAFRELVRITKEVVSYRTVVVLQRDERNFTPTFQASPQRLTAAGLEGRREPLVEKAWEHDRATRGAAPAEASRRLVCEEAQLVAIPLKPKGVLYFGRADEPFSKLEAGRLFFVVRRAAVALLRAEEEEAVQQAFAEQTQVSLLLQKKVSLTTQLLEGAQEILAAGRPEQIYQALESMISRAVPQRFGAVLEAQTWTISRQWGAAQPATQALQALARLVGGEDSKPLYLPSLQAARVVSPAHGVNSALAVPLFGEQQLLAVLVLGAEGQEAFNEEQHDYVYTCAYMAGSGLTSLALFTRLQSAHQQVVQASKLSAIGRLAATVAHELNTPLTAIGLALEAVALRPEKAGDKLNKAGAALDRAREIVSGLLNHARHSGSERSLLEVQGVFAKTLEMVGPQITKRGIAVETRCPELEHCILANSNDLQQILINLLLNAADASAATKGAKLLLFAEKQDAVLAIGVRDWGSGIAPEHLPHLFDPFFTTKDAGLGTGLGLSVCRQLAERHQGTITCQSEPGQGTVFTVRFPARLPGSEVPTF